MIFPEFLFPTVV